MTNIDELLPAGVTIVPAVVGFLLRGTQVLLGKRKMVSLGLGENLIGGIGGKVGDEERFSEETVEEALAREMMEEIQVQVTDVVYRGRVQFVFPGKPKWNQRVDIFIVSSWNGEPVETDVIQPLWFGTNELPISSMWKDNRYWVPLILAGKTVNGLFLYDEDGELAEFHLKVC